MNTFQIIITFIDTNFDDYIKNSRLEIINLIQKDSLITKKKILNLASKSILN